MQRLKVGVIGAGGIAQIEHIPNLMKLKRQFEILGVCDPSAKARAFVSEEFGSKGVELVQCPTFIVVPQQSRQKLSE